MKKKEMIRIDCPFCLRFMAFVKPESDVFCNRCNKYIYIGLKGDKATELKANSTVST